MPVSTTVSEVPVNARVEALKVKHAALSKKVEDAQKGLSTTDLYLNQLKKEKLVVKEKLISEEGRASA